MESIESIKKSKAPSSEEDIKKELKETLKLSPIFELMTPAEKEQFINEEYEKYHKYCKDKKEEKKEIPLNHITRGIQKLLAVSHPLSRGGF